jgi:hypothetical protein
MKVREQKLMVTWFKQTGNLPVPATQAALLERLNATIGREDPKEPAIPSLPQQLQPLAAADAMRECDEELDED